MKNIIVIGALSAIAKQCVDAQAKELCRVALCARKEGALNVFATDMRERHPQLTIKIWVCDMLDTSKADHVWQEMVQFCGHVDLTLVAGGALEAQATMEGNPLLAYELIRTNSCACSLWSLLAANTLESQRDGCLAVITSVAGERGRRSNYIYGSSKAQLIALLEGLRARLVSAGVRVVDFRPGMVDSPMTAHLRKGLLAASSKRVGAELARAMAVGDGVVYSPRFWRGVMFIIVCLPFFIFKKIKF